MRKSTTIRQEKKQITSIGREVRKRLDITFDEVIITEVSISVGDFDATGEEYKRIVEEVAWIAQRTGKTMKSCLLYYLDNTGIFDRQLV